MAYELMTPKSNGDAVSARDWNRIVGNFSQGVPDLMTTKGDLIAGTGVDAAARVPVGANGAYLFAQSSENGGVAWSLPGRASIGSTASVMSISYGNWFDITWLDSDVFDTAGAYDGISTFIAPHYGYYLIVAQVHVYSPTWSSVWTKFLLGMDKNSTLYCQLGGHYFQRTASGSRFDISVGGSCIAELSKGDKLNLVYYSDHASNMFVYRNPALDHWHIMPIL